MGRKKKQPDKLAQDVSKAIAAGMSYGKWKAMQDNPAVGEKKLPEGWKICPQCGVAFKPKSKLPKIYCDSLCQREAAYERAKRKKEAGL